jgi:hypothetical protein
LGLEQEVNSRTGKWLLEYLVWNTICITLAPHLHQIRVRVMPSMTVSEAAQTSDTLTVA